MGAGLCGRFCGFLSGDRQSLPSQRQEASPPAMQMSQMDAHRPRSSSEAPQGAPNRLQAPSTVGDKCITCDGFGFVTSDGRPAEDPAEANRHLCSKCSGTGLVTASRRSLAKRTTIGGSRSIHGLSDVDVETLRKHHEESI
eukprot:TRINITY_DN52735_c0_g1_i1.p1 TRINITY_DN52735_c0_g1~~TRINITY_DN52735_c0_g1_i1.p1  ORF type:complete len:141 (-),score=16.31 TRINITY_DN52735_c0_g1_i1:44-466(-)